MVAKGKGSISATYCAAKNLDMTHCDNKLVCRLRNWIRFVQIHVKHFFPLKKPALCFAHFCNSCFDMVGSEVSWKRVRYLFQWLVGQVQCL